MSIYGPPELPPEDRNSFPEGLGGAETVSLSLTIDRFVCPPTVASACIDEARLRVLLLLLFLYI
jgi:hypothetical protein